MKQLSPAQLLTLRILARNTDPVDALGFNAGTVKVLQRRGLIADVGIWPDHLLVVTDRGRQVLTEFDVASKC